jgi:hypothetical protein
VYLACGQRHTASCPRSMLRPGGEKETLVSILPYRDDCLGGDAAVYLLGFLKLLAYGQAVKVPTAPSPPNASQSGIGPRSAYRIASQPSPMPTDHPATRISSPVVDIFEEAIVQAPFRNVHALHPTRWPRSTAARGAVPWGQGRIDWSLNR